MNGPVILAFLCTLGLPFAVTFIVYELIRARRNETTETETRIP